MTCLNCNCRRCTESRRDGNLCSGNSQANSKYAPEISSNDRDDTLTSKLDNLKISYTRLIRQYTKHTQLRHAINVELDKFKYNGIHCVNLVCEGFSLVIKFNDHSLPDCYVPDTDLTPLKQRFGNTSKAIDRCVANFYQDLKDVNNHLQQQQ